MKHKYSLFVNFETDPGTVLYEGQSYYRKDLSDNLRISNGQIAVHFERSANLNPEDYLYKPLNPVRFQLYRAACFYLAVTGKLPPVKSVCLVSDNQETNLSKAKLTENWEGCCIELKLSADSAKKCFSSDGKKYYIVLTYFLKAQLDHFQHDSFRAAWSGLNALYNDLSESRYERDKLSELSKYLANHSPAEAEEFVRNLSDQFWSQINWYEYVQNHGLSNAAKDVFKSGLYNDSYIYTRLGKCILSLYADQQTDMFRDTYSKKYNKHLTKVEKLVNEELRFLIVEYCYMLRNRSFHADKPYPLFDLPASGKDTEAVLLRLLLILIKDIIDDLS